MSRFKKWLLTVGSFWIVGTVIILSSWITDITWLVSFGLYIIQIGVFLFGLSLFLFAKYIVDSRTKWFIDHGIDYWRGIPVDNTRWNTFGVWMYRIIGVFLMMPILVYLIGKITGFISSS